MNHYANIEDALYSPDSTVTIAIAGATGDPFPALYVKAGYGFAAVDESIIVSFLDTDYHV